MSGTVRAGLVFGLAAVGAVIGSTLLPIPCLSLFAVIALGLGAGYTAAKTTNATRDQRVGRGLTAGAIAGGIALVGTTIAIIVFSQLPFVQNQIQAQVGQALQQNPDLGESGLDPAQLAQLATGLGGVVGGFCAGIMNFLIMLICGLLGALFWKGAAAGQYVPAGGSPYTPPQGGSYIPNQTNTTGYGGTTTTPNEGGPRIYDSNDPTDRGPNT